MSPEEEINRSLELEDSWEGPWPAPRPESTAAGMRLGMTAERPYFIGAWALTTPGVSL